MVNRLSNISLMLHEIIFKDVQQAFNVALL